MGGVSEGRGWGDWGLLRAIIDQSESLFVGHPPLPRLCSALIFFSSLCLGRPPPFFPFHQLYSLLSSFLQKTSSSIPSSPQKYTKNLYSSSLSSPSLSR